PLAAVSFAAVFLQFDVGLNSRHFIYVFAIAILGLGVPWSYAVTQIMVSVSAVVIWTLVLMGLGILALLTSRAVARDLGVQVERQSSLLATLSDLGEGLVITESGRFVAGNDAYVNLTGYSRDELAAMASLVDIAPEEQREQLAANLANRLSGRKVPARYTSALIPTTSRRCTRRCARCSPGKRKAGASRSGTRERTASTSGSTSPCVSSAIRMTGRCTSKPSRSTFATASGPRSSRPRGLQSPKRSSRRRVGTTPRRACSRASAGPSTGSSRSTGRSTRSARPCTSSRRGSGRAAIPRRSKRQPPIRPTGAARDSP